MTLNLCVLTPNRIVWDSEVKEIILSTNSGQIGVLSIHAQIATAVDIGILRIHLNDQWLTMAVMGGFARIGNNEITIFSFFNTENSGKSGQGIKIFQYPRLYKNGGKSSDNPIPHSSDIVIREIDSI